MRSEQAEKMHAALTADKNGQTNLAFDLYKQLSLRLLFARRAEWPSSIDVSRRLLAGTRQGREC